MKIITINQYREYRKDSSDPYTKINSKWIKYLNIRLNSIKPLEQNISRILLDINHSKIFFNPPPRVMKIKTKVNK